MRGNVILASVVPGDIKPARMQNLRDKLLKAGLVSKDQTTAAEADLDKKKEAAKKAREQRHNGGDNRPRGPAPTRPAAPASVESRIPKLPPLALPGSKAFQRLEALKQQELNTRIRDLVKSAEVPLDMGEVKFHFMTRKGKLRRLEISEAQAKLLEEGKLAVVERPEPAMIEHSLVPREAAEKLLPLSEKAVRFYNRDGKPIGFLSDEEMSAEPSAEPEQNEVTEAAAAPEEAEQSAEAKPEQGAE